MKPFLKQMMCCYIWGLSSLNASANVGNAIAVEFFSPTNNRYFISADATEIAAIERGLAGADWARTGGEFSVSTLYREASGLGQVCRFHSIEANAYFLSANLRECLALVDLEASQRAGLSSGGGFQGWAYDSAVFYVATPGSSGTCEQKGLTPIYRLYNNRAASSGANHRYLAGGEAHAEMLAQDWIDEGVAFCSEHALAPAPTGARPPRDP